MIRTYDVCLFGSRSNPETKASVYKLTAESASQPACFVLYTCLLYTSDAADE